MNVASDILAMMRDFGSTIAAGGRTTKGIVDSADEAMMAAGSMSPFIGRSIVVTLRTDDLVLTEGGALTIDGKPYIVREKYHLDDGLLTRILCARG